MCRTWGSNSGPLACQVNSLPIEIPHPVGIIRAASYANNKDASQPAHPRSLISIFVILCLDSITPLASISEISSLNLVSAAVQSGLCPTWSETPEDRFSHDVAQLLLSRQ